MLELAKHLFLLEHTDRQRVPKGFAAGFQLHIDEIAEGSAVPRLVYEHPEPLPLLGVTGETYFTRARDLISDCIAANDGEALPEQFPKELLVHFNQLGRSLRDGETLELPRDGHRVAAVLTPERRKRLVLAADRVYEREVELVGSIAEADWERSTFRLRMIDGNDVVVPMSTAFHPRARRYGGHRRHLVIVKGIGAYDSWERLQKVLNTESLEVIQNFEIAGKFDDLANLQDGWHDGRGRALAEDALAFVAERMVTGFPERLPIPAIVPTQEGNLLLEWRAPGHPSVDMFLSPPRAHFHSFREGGGDLEREFELATPADWASFFAFLARQIPLEPV